MVDGRALALYRRRVPRRVVPAVQILLAIELVAFAISTVPGVRSHAGFDSPLDGWLQGSAYVTLAVLCALRPAIRPDQRRAWTWIAAALAARAVGVVLYLGFVRELDPVPYPSVADALWLAMPLLLLGGFAALARPHLRNVSLRIALDSATGALACAAILLAATFGTLARFTASGVPGEAVAANLAYPLTDFMLLIGAVALVASLAWRAPYAVWLLTGAAVSFAIVDIVHLADLARNEYRPGTQLAALSLVATALIAYAAWARATPPRWAGSPRLTRLVVPSVFALACLAVLVYATRVHVALGVVIVAAGGLVLASVRTLVTYREAADLSAQLQRQLDEAANRARRLERYRATRDTLVRVLAAAPDLDAALRAALETIATGMAWSLGIVWLADDGELRCADVLSVHHDAGDLRRELRAPHYRPQTGLAARSFSTGESVWVEDFRTYEGLSPTGRAIRAGAGEELRAGVSVALRAADDVPAIGVVQFFSGEAGKLDVELLTLMEAMAATIARHVERTRAAQALGDALVDAEDANRAMSEFVSRVSHELRTPLNAILGFAQLLERDADTARERERTAQISSAGAHLVSLIDDLLDLGRIERGELPVSIEPVAATEVVRTVLELAGPLITERDLELELDLHGGLHEHVLADFQRLRQVLLNLVSNAVKYNRPRGKIIVRFETPEPGRLRFVVADTGPGVDEADHPRLFRAFDRLGAESGEQPGTGLGLPVSKALVEAMHGRIGVDSELGTGSAFWVELPLTTAPAPGAVPVVPSPGSRPTIPTAGTVLYIEDNPANVRLMEDIFESLPGMRLLTAMQGALGAELARRHRPDLVLLDAQLPDLDGEGVLGILKAQDETAAVPIVIVSADATDRRRQGFLALGAAAYLTKPIDVGALIEQIGRLVEA